MYIYIYIYTYFFYHEGYVLLLLCISCFIFIEKKRAIKLLVYIHADDYIKFPICISDNNYVQTGKEPKRLARHISRLNFIQKEMIIFAR